MKLTIAKAKAVAALQALRTELQSSERTNRELAIETIKKGWVDNVRYHEGRVRDEQENVKRAKANLRKPISEELIRRNMPGARSYNHRTGEYAPTKFEQVEIELRRLALVDDEKLQITVESSLGKLLGL